jgi:hypothetical protein
MNTLCQIIDLSKYAEYLFNPSVFILLNENRENDCTYTTCVAPKGSMTKSADHDGFKEKRTPS